ncbi:MAG: hypothetical protein COV29_03215 [Candidatus Yanofskybacteria bacterium CG10_big_fil_rev_8_21_14_0_10_36_16]|uniref:Uncharacterized protein n=1 Tax=Candidatus Yanofskybacteria bacterium CG10_big_fil_rev_8_21_14_0_10_36_16 TaxID=1975096 RepID=A0A2J0Q6Z2_9BACT|nr:MAG: hypothetical protein COV29_03215 [Candidatus Yanofskybacteria bacterium CG10_big_fil_rev_8_21_14_0_10_36_16]
MQVVNSNRLRLDRATIVFLKVDMRPSDARGSPEDCFDEDWYLLIKIEPKKWPFGEFTLDELKQIREHILEDDYFCPFNKNLYCLFAGDQSTVPYAFCEILYFIDHDALRTRIMREDGNEENYNFDNPIIQMIKKLGVYNGNKN